jgi:hypothetical protein
MVKNAKVAVRHWAGQLTDGAGIEKRSRRRCRGFAHAQNLSAAHVTASQKTWA